MGLDMYLYKEKYVSNYDFKRKGNNQAQQTTVTIVNDFGDGKKTEKVVVGQQAFGITFKIPVAYWRKVNCVHRYFLERTGTEEDNCKPIEVRGEILKELVDICKEIIADHTKAKELLPTQEGFFFGSTQYDEYYYQDIQDTIDQLKDLDFNEDYIYEASW